MCTPLWGPKIKENIKLCQSFNHIYFVAMLVFYRLQYPKIIIQCLNVFPIAKLIYVNGCFAKT